MMEKEKRDKEAPTTTLDSAEKKPSDISEVKKHLEVSKAPAAKKGKKQPVSKAIAPENDLINGLKVRDYSHLYKSFYDIFVGQVLEPKTFDLQFVVRDTRNTYAAFVSLMTSVDVKKKYQFEQAPMERSLADYYQGAP
jgi:hypothetical protein